MEVALCKVVDEITCSDAYIGQTARHLTRLKGHGMKNAPIYQHFQARNEL